MVMFPILQPNEEIIRVIRLFKNKRLPNAALHLNDLSFITAYFIYLKFGLNIVVWVDV